MRLAWFTPWPPQTSGVAGRSVDVIGLLAGRGHAIDVFVDRRFVPNAGTFGPDAPQPGDVRVQSAHEFVWRHHRGQYDLAVYQAGNSRDHAFIWPYLLRFPGLTVLHDARLHHARGAALITAESADPYRRALAVDHPDVLPAVAELAVAGFDGGYYALWPMIRSFVLASRTVAVHTRGGAAALQQEFPGESIEYLALGEGRVVPLDEAARRDVRARLQIPPDALLFGVFGGLTAEKRVPQILRAIARLARSHPLVHLLLAGKPDRRLGIPALADSLGLANRLTLAPDLDDESFDAAVWAVDVSLNLRWPTARETSGPWLQALAAGRPTVIVDLAHQAHVPALDPRTWRHASAIDGETPVTVAIDILDEDHSLGLALARLAQDAELRASLGAAARRYWEREHTVARMADDYERVAALTLARPARASRLPPGFPADPLRATRDLVAPFGPLTCELF